MATVNTNYVLKSNSSVDFTNTSQSLIYDDGTNVGISTSGPVSKLHVVQNSVPTGLGALPTGTTVVVDAASANNYITLRNSTDTGTYSGILFEDNNVGAYIAFRTYVGSGANDGSNGDYMLYGTYTDHIFQAGSQETVNGKTEIVRFKQNGNVGIGTTNPGTKLEVNGAIRGGSFSASTTNSGEAWVGRASDRTLGTYTIQLGGSSATGTTWEIVDRAWTKVIASISGEAPAASFTVTNTGVVYMNGGSVGIGTTNPLAKLQVNISTGPDGLTVTGSVRQTSYFQSSGEHSWVYINSAHSNTYLPMLFLQRNSTTLGTVQLQRASSSDSLGSFVESEMVVGSSTNTPMSLQTNGVRRMVISGSNVGVGTTNPAQLLTIGGGAGFKKDVYTNINNLNLKK